MNDKHVDHHDTFSEQRDAGAARSAAEASQRAYRTDYWTQTSVSVRPCVRPRCNSGTPRPIFEILVSIESLWPGGVQQFLGFLNFSIYWLVLSINRMPIVSFEKSHLANPHFLLQILILHGKKRVGPFFNFFVSLLVEEISVKWIIDNWSIPCFCCISMMHGSI